MRLLFFSVGALFILGATTVIMFAPDAVMWFLHRPFLDGFLGLVAVAFHWFNTYAPKEPFIPKV